MQLYSSCTLPLAKQAGVPATTGLHRTCRESFGTLGLLTGYRSSWVRLQKPRSERSQHKHGHCGHLSTILSTWKGQFGQQNASKHDGRLFDNPRPLVIRHFRLFPNTFVVVGSWPISGPAKLNLAALRTICSAYTTTDLGKLRRSLLYPSQLEPRCTPPRTIIQYRYCPSSARRCFQVFFACNRR